MKTLVTVVTERGQVSIPAVVRKRLNLTPGTRVVWSIQNNDQCVLAPAASPKVRGAKAMLGFASTYMQNNKNSDDWLAELREGEKNGLGG